MAGLFTPVLFPTLLKLSARLFLDPCGRRKYAITTLFDPTPSPDPMLFQVRSYASSLDSVVNSLPQVSGCPCPSSFQENHLLILQRLIAALAYGILAIIDGIIGYVHAQSKASLISGSISGLFLIFAGVMQLQGQVWGLILATVVTTVLIIVFAIRLAKTRKFMPAGLISVLGLVVRGVMVNQLVGSV